MNAILTSLQGAEFPLPRNAVHGVWAAIFIEPMVGSGERICVGVGAATNAGNEVVQVPALSRLECLCGENVRDPDGHHLVNKSNSPARVLEIGTSDPKDRFTYPDIDMIADNRGYTHRDGTPYPLKK
jgi:hypothetical protein